MCKQSRGPFALFVEEELEDVDPLDLLPHWIFQNWLYWKGNLQILLLVSSRDFPHLLPVPLVSFYEAELRLLLHNANESINKIIKQKANYKEKNQIKTWVKNVLEPIFRH